MSRHMVLIVEDDPKFAIIAQELFGRFGYDTMHAGSSEEAHAIFREREFCASVFDLEMKETPGARLASITQGIALIGDFVRMFPGSDDGIRRLPFGVMSSVTADPHYVSLCCAQLGASAWFKKPLDENMAPVRVSLEEMLARSRRGDHDRCGDRFIASRPAQKTLVVTSHDTGLRTEIIACGRRMMITNTSARLLLELIAARLQPLKYPDGWIHGLEIGGDKHGLRSKTEATRELLGVLIEPIQLLEGAGKYRLDPEIHVDHVDWSALTEHSNKFVSALAQRQISAPTTSLRE